MGRPTETEKKNHKFNLKMLQESAIFQHNPMEGIYFLHKYAETDIVASDWQWKSTWGRPDIGVIFNVLFRRRKKIVGAG